MKLYKSHTPSWRMLSYLTIACIGASFFGSGEGAGEVSNVLLGLIVILVGAKLGAEGFERMKSPPVLGELLFGILIGNLNLLGINSFEFIKSDAVIYTFSEIGVMFLLFSVGLETTVS